MNLSPRQHEIVLLVGRDGAEWKTVEASLGISRSTVRDHVARILERYPTQHGRREALVEIYWRYVAPQADAL